MIERVETPAESRPPITSRVAPRSTTVSPDTGAGRDHPALRTCSRAGFSGAGCALEPVPGADDSELPERAISTMPRTTTAARAARAVRRLRVTADIETVDS